MLPPEAPYDEGLYKASMKHTGSYECGGNLFWLNLRFSTCASVPYNFKAVDNLRSQFFGKTVDGKFPAALTIAMEPEAVVNDSLGSLRCISPEEIVHSYIFHVAERIDAGATENELKMWRSAALNVTLIFEVHSSEDSRYWRNVNLREQFVGMYEVCARSQVQRIFELMSFKVRKEATSGRLTPKDLPGS